MALVQIPSHDDNIRGVSPGTAPTRYALFERFNRLPGINADVGIAYNLDFELLGTSAVSADLSFYAEGGINLATHGGATDSAIVLPHLDAAQSAWTGVTWGTDQKTWWGCHIRTNTALTNTTIWAGLKLTNTPTAATDNDQIFFRYANGTDTYWQMDSSVGGTDTFTASDVTVAASTEYVLEVRIDSSRVGHFLINGVEKGQSSALTNTTDLIPYIGVLSATDATAKTVIVRSEWISRVVA